MRLRLPRRLDDLCRLAQLGAPRQHLAGDRCRRHEVGRELHRLEGACERAVLVAVAAGERVGGEEHGAVAPRRRLVEEPERGAPLDGRERAAPVAVGALRLEHRLVRPADGGREPRRLAGIGAGRDRVAAPARLDEEAAQPEHARLGILGHAAEGRLGAAAVAGDLRRLRLEEERQRLAAEKPLGLAGVPAGGAGIAGSDRHHAARHRRITLGTAPRPRRIGHAVRHAEHEGHHRPQEGERDRDADRQHRRDRDRGLGLVAAPVDDDVAGPVGEPDGAEGGKRQEADENECAPHADEAPPSASPRRAPPKPGSRSRGRRPRPRPGP